MLLRLKVWMLNLKRMEESADTAFGQWLNDLKAKDSQIEYETQFQYYKVFHNDPNYHMMYSVSYLQSTSLLSLLVKHNGYRNHFRYMYLKAQDANG